MTDQNTKFGTPTALAQARSVAHAAVQLLTKAARANLAAVPDDSHSSLEWSVERQMFLTHPLGTEAPAHQVGLTLLPLQLVLLCDGERQDELLLGDQSLLQAAHWLDRRLADIGLGAASPVVLPYELPDDVSGIVVFPEATGESLAQLAAWYSLAATALKQLSVELVDLVPGPSPVSCWPHHFDIATYVALETGDAETARGIGVGMSPGDGSYDQPYFYVNPWPHLDVASLPPPLTPGHWHTEGFVGSIATGEEILTLDSIGSGTLEFLRASVSAGRKNLGI